MSEREVSAACVCACMYGRVGVSVRKGIIRVKSSVQVQGPWKEQHACSGRAGGGEKDTLFITILAETH